MMFDPRTTGETEGDRRPFTIPLPFLRESIGAGDMVKSLTDALHIRQCGGCRDRQQAMNQAVGFWPMRSIWED